MDLLLDRIEREQLKPGDLLPSERQLMEEYGVGRPAVREALQTLDRMGIVTIHHGERSRIAEPSAQAVLERLGQTARHALTTSRRTFEDLKHARMVFEMGLVREAARKADATAVAKLRKCLEAQEAAMDRPTAFMRGDMAFHREIAEIAGNPILALASQALFEWLMAFHTSLVRAPGAETLTLEEHAGLVEAIAAHDPDAAEERMHAHLTRANALYDYYDTLKDKKPDG